MTKNKKSKWDGKSRVSNDLYRKNFEKIFGKVTDDNAEKFVHEQVTVKDMKELLNDLDDGNPNWLKGYNKWKKENASYKGKSCGPGGIQFVYGDGPIDCVTYQSFMPEENDMYIFPAWLKHWVAPYKSDCIRISVSGNVHDSAPLNNIERFAPAYAEEKAENEQYLKELKKKL